MSGECRVATAADDRLQHTGRMPTTVARILAALLLALAAAIASPTQVAYACSCADIDTDQAMENASAVFDGAVAVTSEPTSGASSELIESIIEVTRVYQGSVPATVTVRSAASGASCGVELTGEVTVFAQGPVEDLRTTSCSAPASIDRARLGAGRPPAGAPAATEAPISPHTSEFDLDGGPLVLGMLAKVLGTLAGALVLVGAATWMVRRRR